MEKQPELMTLCNLECVLMPNGEIISMGKTLGFFERFKKYLTFKETLKESEAKDVQI